MVPANSRPEWGGLGQACLGETLALFRERITLREMPVVRTEENWNTLPADPRQLRAVPPRQA